MTKLRLTAAFCVLAALAGAQSSLFQMLDNPIPGPTAVQAAGDVDGDGDEDLLVPDGLLVNDGHGRFAMVVVGSVAFTRQNPKLVDLNGDGLADLISFIPTTGPAVAHLRIDLSVGTTFVLGSILMSSAPPSPTRVAAFAVGDVDGDGDQDILAGTWNGTSAATAPVLWLNDGFATFTQSPGSVPPSPMSPSVVLLGDLDADGDLDAVFAVSSAAPLLPPADVQVALNAGGVFSLVPTPIFTGSVNSIVVARANNDALLDIVFVASGSAIVAVNSPSGFLAPVGTFIIGAYSPPMINAAVDVNGDGIDELLQWMPTPRNLALRPITAGGQLGPPLQSWTDLRLQPFIEHQTVARDLDGDGDRDVIALTDRESIALMNDGAGSLVRTGGRVLGVASTSNQNVGDLDGDGDVDVLGLDAINNVVSGTLAVGYNDGDGFFAGAPLSIPLTGLPYHLRTFDRDGDGDLDLYAMLQTNGGLFPGPDRVFDNSGGTFTLAGTVNGAQDGRILRSADFDGDGDQDLVIARILTGGLVNPALPMAFIRNLGAGGMAAPVSIGTNHFTFDLDLADFDGNGTLDVFQTNSPLFQPDPSVLYRNNGNGTFLPVVLPMSGHFTAAGDLNGDVLPDVVMNGQVWFNAGAGTFVAGPALSSALIGSASLADVDLDGDLDLVEAPGTVMFNAGGGIFGPAQPYLPQQAAANNFGEFSPSTVVDLDQDGDPDIIAPGPSVLINTTRQIAHGSIARPGRPASIDLYGTPGGGWLLGTANGATSSSLPPFGTLLIDPASAQIMAMGTFAGPASPLPGTASLGALVPNNPALIGWTTWWQAIDMAALRLTNRIRITVTSF